MELQSVHDIRTRPPMPKAARLFNLAVAALMFCAMLGFAAWSTVSSFTQGGRELLPGVGGVMIGAGAVTLLAAVYAEWQTAEPFQHSRRFVLGTALLGLGATLLLSGLTR